jgi:glycosyltransferase involved in cell wall biosynthesis
MSELPRITIVTPSYNQGAYIEATLKSVLTQAYPALEYIVIDGGSNDDTPHILQRYTDQLAYWLSEADDGQADAINKGFARSTGQIMGWLNSDDVLLPGALWQVARTFQAQPQARLVTGLRQIIDADGRHERYEMLWYPEHEVIRRAAFIAQETTFWQRSLWDAIGPLDASYQFALDYEYWQRALAAGYTFTLIPAYLGGFRRHADAKTSQADALRTAELTRIYQHYGIADDETAAHQQLKNILGPAWRHQQRMLREFGERRSAQDAMRYVRYFKLLRSRAVGPALTQAHRLYNRVRGRPVY